MADHDRSFVTAPPRHPSRALVLEIGDSLGEDLAWGLPSALKGTKAKFVSAAVGDTGLAETWYYNWALHLRRLLSQYHPSVVVVFLGANDVESFYVDNQFVSFGSHAWASVYGARVNELIDETVSARADLVWVGMPPMMAATFSEDMQTLNAVYRDEVRQHRSPGSVTFVSTWSVLGGPGGQFKPYSSGSSGQLALRAPDGVHITPWGAALVAKAVVARMTALGWVPG